MDYKKIYEQLIEKRRNNPVPKEIYSEKHHIIPRCMGGTNKKENIVRLTAKEHYMAHALLYKHYRTSKLAFAWFNMCRVSEEQKRNITSKQYEMASKAKSIEAKKSMRGKGNPFFGKTHTDKTKKIISESKRGWKPSKEHVEKWIEKVAKLPCSEEHKEAISRAKKGKIVIQNKLTKENLYIDKSELWKYDSNLWGCSLKGRKRIQNIETRKIKYIYPDEQYDPNVWTENTTHPQKNKKCEICGKETIAVNIVRWHGKGKCI